MALAIEVAELMEHFQWLTPEEALNVADRIAIVRGERGNVRTVKLSDDVPIDKIDVGDEVRLRITEAIAVSVQAAD